MTDSLPAPVDRALSVHDAFEEDTDGYELTTTVFEATVTASETDDGHRFEVAIVLPSLSGAVTDDAVAPIVEDDWFETLERRLADADTVATATETTAQTLERAGDTVTVSLEYVASGPASGVSDAKAMIEFVEGTYAQGLIPGYEYEGPAARLLESAKSRGETASEGERGGMPL